jgi:hypothetical protein
MLEGATTALVDDAVIDVENAVCRRVNDKDAERRCVEQGSLACFRDAKGHLGLLSGSGQKPGNNADRCTPKVTTAPIRRQTPTLNGGGCTWLAHA